MINTKSFDINSTTVNTKKFELFNIVSETGDSIYTVPMEESATIGEGQIYVSLSEIKKIINEELERRLGPSINNKNEQ